MDTNQPIFIRNRRSSARETKVRETKLFHSKSSANKKVANPRRVVMISPGKMSYSYSGLVSLRI